MATCTQNPHTSTILYLFYHSQQFYIFYLCSGSCFPTQTNAVSHSLIFGCACTFCRLLFSVYYYSYWPLPLLLLLYIYDVDCHKNHTGNGKKMLRYYLRLASVCMLCMRMYAMVYIYNFEPSFPQKALTVSP